MQFEPLARNYLKKFQEKCADAWGAGANAIELSTRPVVHDFVENLSKLAQSNVTVLHDTQLRTSRNKPDWRMEDNSNFGTYCYGDHKDLSKDNGFSLNSHEQSQISRYLDLGYPVFVFDGVEFLFFKDDITQPERILLIPKPLDLNSDWSSLPIEPLIENRFRELLNSSGFRQWTESDIIQQLARRARLLSDTVQNLLNSPVNSGVDISENELIGSLHNLSDLVQQHHDPGLADSRACGDFVAQVLAFGLFFAHTKAPDFGTTSEERHTHIQNFWLADFIVDEAKHLRPFQSITESLGKSLSSDNDLASWYHDSANLLAHAEYVGTSSLPEDYHTLFEKFLDAFDKQTRFDRGAFYTPTVLANWMARETDSLSQSHFGGSLCEVAEKIIDPCCGTGGILEAIITQTSIPDDSLPSFIGFEVLPAPYALAHYRLNKLLTGTPLEGCVRILLTDTLSDFLNAPPSGSGGFADELSEAGGLAQPPLHIVIGNPPSSDHIASKAPRNTINEMLASFRPPKDKRADRQNFQQALNNEAIRFLRWSAQKVIDTGRGILTLILPGSFAYSVSFKYARKWVIENFQDIYVLMLDQDVRTGVSGNSIFDVLQGRLVLFAVLNPPPENQEEAKDLKVSFYDISKISIEEKQSILNSDTSLLGEFSQVVVNDPSWNFLPTGPYPENIWNASWPLRNANGLTGIFKSKCSAVKLAPTSVLFHTEKGLLQRRSQAIANQHNSEWSSNFEELKILWWQGQQKPPNRNKFTDDVRKSLGTAAADSVQSMIPYSYRPFLEGFVLSNDTLFESLGQAPGDGTRARPEIRAAYGQGALGIALSPSTIDLGDTLTRFVSFAWHLPDNDIAARGNAMVYCNLFPEEKKGTREWDSSAHKNFTHEISELFPDSVSNEEILFYVYAVMNCRSYLEAFEPVLYGPSDPDTPPRVPICNDPEIRNSIIGYGKKIAECEKELSPVINLPGVQCDWPDTLDEIRLKSYSIDDSASTIELIGEGGETIQLANIPDSILSLHVSGHWVVSKWLRERKFVYLRRTFRKSDLDNLFGLMTRISAQDSLLEEVDLIVKNILSIDKLEPPPIVEQ